MYINKNIIGFHSKNNYYTFKSCRKILLEKQAEILWLHLSGFPEMNVDVLSFEPEASNS